MPDNFYIDLHSHSSALPSNGMTIRSFSLGHETIPAEVLWYSAGIHPWYIAEDYEARLEELKVLSADPRMLAIGECGLDRVKGPEFILQEDVFMKSIALSEEVKKPLILHSVRSSEEMIQMRRMMKPAQPWVFHGYNLAAEKAQRMQTAGILLSFGAAILRSDSPAAQTLQAMGDAPFFLETDDSGIEISTLYAAAATLLHCSESDLCTRISYSFQQLFPSCRI